MNKNFTQGEWAASETAPMYVQEKKSGQIIAHVHDKGLTWTEADANANLMAAAPELLDAVQKTLAFFDDIPKGQFGKIVCNVGMMNEMFLALSASVKKAIK